MTEMEMSTDKVEIFRDDAGEIRWRRLNGENGQEVSNSGEGYHNHMWALRAAQKLNKDVLTSNIIDLTDSDPTQAQ